MCLLNGFLLEQSPIHSKLSLDQLSAASFSNFLPLILFTANQLIDFYSMNFTFCTCQVDNIDLICHIHRVVVLMVWSLFL